MNEIARLVFPTESFIDNTELFLNKEIKECFFYNKLTKVNVYKFNTWMNLFAPKKHYFYCNLGEIYLNLSIKGKYKIQIIGSNKNAAFDRFDEILVEADCENDACIKVPGAKKYEAIYFTLIEDASSPVEIFSGAWATDNKPERVSKLAIVTCTFKRENYINKNIKTFEDFVQANPSLKEYIKLIVVDNGKTLDTARSSDIVKIIPNMNAGGAGGFTRGLMDVLENHSDYTRVLFMDDDVEIFPESFYRTMTLANYLKPEFKDAYINGAMMDLYNKTLFYENLAIQDKLWVHPLRQNLDVCNYDNILKINDISNNIFDITNNQYVGSAWYYHCFSLDIAKQKGLPVPVFFRGDDVEWSWRGQGLPHISMNGICIWHAPFIWRVSSVADVYYLPRNMFFINSVYTKNFKSQYKRYYVSKFKYLYRTYDYVSIELLLKAMNDILRGAAVYMENPEAQFKSISEIAKQVEYFDADEHELDKAKHSIARYKKWRGVISFLTAGGKYCPDFLFKSKNTALEWYPPSKIFRLVKELKVYNLLKGKYAIRKFDRKKSSDLKREFYRLLNLIDKNYDNLHSEYLEAHKEFSTMEFWKNYLELNVKAGV